MGNQTTPGSTIPESGETDQVVLGNVWAAHVTSFRGSGFGAMHSYAVLEAPDVALRHTDGLLYSISGQKYAVLRVLDEDGARELNELNERFGRDYATDNKAGDVTQQFNSDELAEAAALAVWQHVCAEQGLENQVLLATSGFGVHGPCKPLGGPDEVLTRLREIWELDESETSNAWTAIRQQADEQWQEALTQFELEEVRPDGLLHRTGPGYPKAPDPLDVYCTPLRDGTYEVRFAERWR